MKLSTILLLLAGLLAAAHAQAPVADMIAVSWSGVATAIDSTTGMGTSLGSSGVTQLNNMARDPVTGTIYVLGNGAAPAVHTMNTVSGALTPTGVNIGAGNVRGLAFDSTGTGWAIVDGSPDALYTVNLVTGAFALVGPTGYSSLQSLAADPITGTLYGWDVNAGVNPPCLVSIDRITGAGTGLGGSGVPAGDIQALTFSANGVLYGCRDALYTISTTTGAATLVGGGGYADVRGCDFITGGPPATPAYPGNGSDVATVVGVNGLARPGLPGVHTVNAGDVVSLGFVSPGGTLAFSPFLAFFQLFPTGAPPFPDPVLGLFIDPLLPGGVIADGLSNPAGLFNPVLDAWQAVGGVPFGLGGTGTSILVNCVALDLGFPPFNVGIAQAQEFVVN